jgi:carbon-monoxide dehydrogenase medium subunit
MVTARDFHQGPYMNVLADDEILTEIRVPIRPGAGSAYEKVKRRAGDWAVAGVGTYVVLTDGVIADVGIGLTAVGAPGFCAEDAESYLIGKPATDEHFAEAGRLAAAACTPRADQRGPIEYKRHLVQELTERALRRSVERAHGGA